MKKIIFVALICLSTKMSIAQITDTTGYLRDSIGANKANYIGQPLSHLLNNLRLAIQFETTVPPSNNLPDTIVLNKITLNFYPLSSLIDRLSHNKKLPSITIIFSQPIKIPKAFFISIAFLDKGSWTYLDAANYGGYYVADLRIEGL